MTAPTGNLGGRMLGRPAVDPRFRARRIAVRREAGRRRLRRLLALAAVAVVALATVTVLKSPVLDVDEIAVSGGRYSGPDVIRETAGVDIGAPLLLADLDRAETRIESLPWVAEATVTRDLPGAVEIRVEERTAVAKVSIVGRSVVVDDSGRILATDELPPAVPDQPTFVTVVAPGAATPPALGGVVDADLLDAVGLAGRLRANPAGAVATVRVRPSLHLELTGGGRVEFGDATALDDKVEAFRTTFARVDLTCLDTLDVRVPTHPVLTREGACS